MASTPGPLLEVPAEKACAVCKEDTGTHLVCARCCAIYYCSKKCQLSDWKIHRTLCKVFAEAPRPDSAQGEHLRRILFFHPRDAKAEVVWVDHRLFDWAIPVLRSVKDRPIEPAPESESIDVQYILNPLSTPDGQHHHTQLIVRGGYRPTQVMPVPTQLMPINGVRSDGSLFNKAITSTMNEAELPFPASPTPVDYPTKPHIWHGPLILARYKGKDRWAEYLTPGVALKLQDITMADYRDFMLWFSTHNNLGLELFKPDAWTTQEADLALQFLTNLRLCPKNQVRDIHLERHSTVMPGPSLEVRINGTIQMLKKIWESMPATEKAKHQ